MSDKYSPKAQELADKWGLQLDRTIYYGSDHIVQTNPADAISASKGFEETSGNSQGSTGGCGQSPENVSSDERS